MDTEAAAITAAVQLHKDLDALAVRARALASDRNLPAGLRESVTEFADYCIGTLHDCDIPAAVRQWDEDQPRREAGRVAYAREVAADLRAAE